MPIPRIFDNLSTKRVSTTEPGILIVYVDNQTMGKDVWFDNVQVLHYNTQVLEENHYYPFGLTVSTSAMGITEQKYKYQGIELEKNFGLETYETYYRGLDPQLGRFNSIDPKAELDYGLSPFVSMRNNPVMNVDPMGDVSRVSIDGNNITLSSTVYVMGDDAARHVQELNDFVKNNAHLYRGQYGDYNMQVNVTYELATEAMIKTKNPGEGNNLMEFADLKDGSSVTTIIADQIKNEKNVITGWGPKINVGNYIKMNSANAHMSSAETGDHEAVGHAMMGLSDRYTDTYPERERVSTPHKGFENDRMGGRTMEVKQIHWDNLGKYILKQGKSSFILNKIVDIDENGKLKN